MLALRDCWFRSLEQKSLFKNLGRDPGLRRKLAQNASAQCPWECCLARPAVVLSTGDANFQAPAPSPQSIVLQYVTSVNARVCEPADCGKGDTNRGKFIQRKRREARLKEAKAAESFSCGHRSRRACYALWSRSKHKSARFTGFEPRASPRSERVLNHRNASTKMEVQPDGSAQENSQPTC
jgi:hypothetical protein